ncbi:hypothetical protein [Pseudarthrobacter sp. NS4]|uniref:hypothetical protein n=1 Tax=Pseudarthrobacter sp. NS4 TaxID=2973976 RepID=UPI0021625892|nr:hypothetical protein [Pseudarthrobacter sp. NS4]
MATLRWSSLGKLRCLVSLRSVFVWVLVAVLVAGAASYTHGSRYKLVGHGPFQPAAAQSAGPAAVPPPAEAAVGAGETSLPASGAVRAVHQAVPYAEPEELEGDCCERRQAPRSEPAPVRTGAVDPPSSLHRQPGDAVLFGAVPAAPDLPSLSVVQLSISRT